MERADRTEPMEREECSLGALTWPAARLKGGVVEKRFLCGDGEGGGGGMAARVHVCLPPPRCPGAGGGFVVVSDAMSYVVVLCVVDVPLDIVESLCCLNRFFF